MRGRALYEKVLTACGMSSVLGPGLLERSLRDVGVDVVQATVTDYYRSLPRLEARLRAYQSAGEAADRVNTIRTHLARIPDS